MQRKLAAVLALDVVGYSRLMGSDEEVTLQRMKLLFSDVIRPAVKERQGRIVKLMGDGLLAEFPSVVESVKCAIEIQQSVAGRDEDTAEDQRIILRMGVNLGDIILEGSDIYGDGVNLAARLEAAARPGGICIADSTHQAVRDKLPHSFEDGGEIELKNISRPVQVWHWHADHSDSPPVRSSPPEPKVPGIGKSSLAVLPLENMSSNEELTYLADGLTEDLITLLARLPGFLVIARNSSFAYKGTSPDIRQVGRELGVSYVVEGSLRPVGKNVRVTIQLIEAETGNHLWANKFDRPADEFDEMQDEITLGIASRLEPELAKAEVKRIKKRGESSVDAWGYYNQAAGLLSLKGWHRSTFVEANELLRKAIELDPEFALAQAYLSLIMALGHMFGLSPEGQDDRALAIKMAEQAMSMDNVDSTVLGFTGCALSDVGLVERGSIILQRAIDADPSNPQAWVALGTAMLRSGKARKGVEYLQHGMRISPHDNRLSFWGTSLAYAMFRLRDFDGALAEINLACKRDEGNYMARVVLALILVSQERVSEAQQAIDEALRLRQDLRCTDVQALIGRRGVQLLMDAQLLN
ncbi:MAG: adenylate/guanylate cyclase domain-containing protein [Rhizobiaceae bacterium]